MTKVICKQVQYDYEMLRPVIFDLMSSLGGDEIQSNSRVLIKPNLLAPASPDRAMVTHPHVIRAVVEYVNERGARPQVSDSPAIGSFKKILKESHIAQALEGLDVECREFTESVAVNVGKPFNRIDIARDAMEADMVINLPKLKTHVQMKLTLSVKNLFGCIVGMKKPEWHFRAGIDREMFADLLARICKAVSPRITIMDGILAMEGQGPGKGGTPKNLGLVIASSNPVALDVSICSMLGLEPDKLLTNRMSGTLEDEIVIEGDMPRVSAFKMPVLSPLLFGPQAMQGFTRRHIVQRPVCAAAACRLCGECWKYCPAHAISHDTERIYINYDSCIRCYCCVEVCPYGALEAKETPIGKIANKILKIR